MTEQTVLTARERGTDGEQRAAVFLEQNGYRIIERNWRCRGGEADIIAHKDETLVFGEVKTWVFANTDTLGAALGSEKQKRIIKTAKRFLVEHRQYNDSYIRFDVLLVDMFGNGCIEHIENAFSEFL